MVNHLTHKPKAMKKKRLLLLRVLIVVLTASFSSIIIFVVVSPEFELATSDMIVQFALRSLGVGSVVKDFAKEYIENGMLFELRFNTMLPKRDFYVITDSETPLSTAAKNLLKLINGEEE